MRMNDTLVGALVALFGLSIILRALTFPDMPGHDFGPGFFPSLIGAGFIAFSVPLLYRGIREWSGQSVIDIGDWTGSPRKIVAGLWVVAGLVAYIGLFDILGFIVVNVIYATGFMTILRVSPWKAAIFALIGSLAVNFVFTRFLYVPLPAGVLGFGS